MSDDAHLAIVNNPNFALDREHYDKVTLLRGSAKSSIGKRFTRTRGMHFS